MRIEISPEPTPEERAVIEAAVARLFMPKPSPVARGRSPLIAPQEDRWTKQAWRAVARAESVDDGV